MPRTPSVTAFAHRKVIASESLFSIVTGHTTKSGRRSVVIQRLWRRNFACGSANTVTFVTTQPLIFVMTFMTKSDAKRSSIWIRSTIWPLLVTNSARRNVALARLGLRSMTLKASSMCFKSGRNGERDSATRRSMTHHASHVSHSSMTRVIECHIEGTQSWKCFKRA